MGRTGYVFFSARRGAITSAPNPRPATPAEHKPPFPVQGARPKLTAWLSPPPQLSGPSAAPARLTAAASRASAFKSDPPCGRHIKSRSPAHRTAARFTSLHLFLPHLPSYCTAAHLPVQQEGKSAARGIAWRGAGCFFSPSPFSFPSFLFFLPLCGKYLPLHNRSAWRGQLQMGCSKF